VAQTDTPASPGTRRHGKNAFFFIIVTVFIDMMAFAVIMPVLPNLVAGLLNGEAALNAAIVAHDAGDLKPLETMLAAAAPWSGWISTVYAVINFLAQPILGNLSDRFGRRPVLLASMAMLAIDFLIMGAAHSIWLLFLGRFLSGLSAATHSTAAAYIADVTEPEQRGQAYGMLGAAFGLGFILGPAIGGFLGQFDPRAPFFAAAALAALNFLYGVFVLPESLDREHRRAFDWKRANALGAFRHFSKLPHLAWFMLALGFFNFAHWVYPATFNYFGSVRYGWDPGMIGLALAVVGVGSAIVQGALVGPIIKKFGATRVTIFGFVGTVAVFLAYAFATEGWMVFVIIIFGAFTGVLGPALNQIMTARVARNAQGELQGAMASVTALANMTSPLIMTQTFFHFSQPPWNFAGAAFVLAALMAALSLIPLAKGLRSAPRIEETGGPPPPEDGHAPAGEPAAAAAT
jgi:DHA1 family tetracycline resistance protein-like MFS transporter